MLASIQLGWQFSQGKGSLLSPFSSSLLYCCWNLKNLLAHNGSDTTGKVAFILTGWWMSSFICRGTRTGQTPFLETWRDGQNLLQVGWNWTWMQPSKMGRQELLLWSGTIAVSSLVVLLALKIMDCLLAQA